MQKKLNKTAISMVALKIPDRSLSGFSQLSRTPRLHCFHLQLWTDQKIYNLHHIMISNIMMENQLFNGEPTSNTQSFGESKVAAASNIEFNVVIV